MTSEELRVLETKIHESIIANSNVEDIIHLYGYAPYSLMFLTCCECRQERPIEFSFIVQDQEDNIIAQSIQMFLLAKDDKENPDLAFSPDFLADLCDNITLEFLCGTCLGDRGFKVEELDLPTCKAPEEITF